MDYIDDLFDEWDDRPPLRMLVAQFMGVKPKEKPSKDYSELIALFPGGQIRGITNG